VLPETLAAAASGPDRFQYDLEIQDAAGRGHRVRFGEEHAPAALVSLAQQVKLHARVGDGVVPGVVAMPSGWWASLSPGGSSANALTADGLSDLGGGGDFHDTLVQVELLAPPRV